MWQEIPGPPPPFMLTLKHDSSSTQSRDKRTDDALVVHQQLHGSHERSMVHTPFFLDMHIVSFQITKPRNIELI